MQSLQKKYGRIFATHSFTNSTPSLAFVLYWAFSWWNCSPWPWLAWEFTSTTLKMAHFHAIWHQQQMLPPLQVSHNELQKILKLHILIFCLLCYFTRFFLRNICFHYYSACQIQKAISKFRIRIFRNFFTNNKKFWSLACFFEVISMQKAIGLVKKTRENLEWDVGIVEYQNK